MIPNNSQKKEEFPLHLQARLSWPCGRLMMPKSGIAGGKTVFLAGNLLWSVGTSKNFKEEQEDYNSEDDFHFLDHADDWWCLEGGVGLITITFKLTTGHLQNG